MIRKLTARRLPEQLSGLLDHAVETGTEYLVRRNGEDHVVVLSARAWKRLAVGKPLDALGTAYRLPKTKQ